ncbi:MAG: molybdopterin cofactor-binding domain-containing protein [Thermoplasmata archaeon]
MSGSREVVPFDLLPPTERAYFDRFGDGLVVVLPAQRPSAEGWGRGGPPHGGAWIHLGEEGMARAFTGKVEVGQGTKTALSLLVAEELRLPLGLVELTMGDTDVCPWDMGTFGSRSMPDAGEHLRTTGAAARTFLLEIAAAKLEVAVRDLDFSDGRVWVKGTESSHSVGFGELVKGLRRVEMVPPSTQPVPPSEWTRAGRPTTNLGGREVVTGSRQYTSDLHLPGMLYGKVLFPPAYGAKLRHVDLSRAQALPGVTAVHEGDFVAVAAPSLLTAHAAVRAIRADWETTPQPSEKHLVEYLRQHPAEGEEFWDVIHHEAGNVTAALAAASVSLEETYTTAFIAHVPMETHAVVATWEDGRLTVWLGTQTPFRARDALADALGLHPSNVRVVVPPTGSGFGGKHAAELAVGAARLAKAAGRPVRITYSREEEFTQAYFRPMAVIDIRSGATKEGEITAWQFHNLNAGSAAARIPYKVPNQKIDNQPASSPLPQGSYRALAAVANNFARESHVDELAARFGADPVEYRLRHVADDRLAAVLRAVAERAGWVARPQEPRRAPGPGHGRGIAVGLEKGGRVATFAEVEAHSDRRLEVVRIVTGFECGAIVHPTNLRSQVEGGTIMALGGALFEAVHFEDGRVLNPKLSQYRVPRFGDVPSIEVVLLDRRDLPAQGGGEAPLLAVAPAIANAIYDATGQRLRSLPLVPDGTLP